MRYKVIVLIATVVFLSFYAGGVITSFRNTQEDTAEYITSCINGEQKSLTALFKNNLADNLTVFGGVFFSGFFSFGILTLALILGYLGARSGVASACIMQYLGIKGILLCFFDVAIAVAVIFYAACCAKHILIRRADNGGFLVVSGIALFVFVVLSACDALLLSELLVHILP